MDNIWGPNFTLDRTGHVDESETAGSDGSAAAGNSTRSESPEIQYLGATPAKSFWATGTGERVSPSSSQRSNMLRNPAHSGEVIEPRRPAFAPEYYNVEANMPVIDEAFVRRNRNMDERPGDICSTQMQKQTCFNCLGPHMISDCPLPRDPQAIGRNRRSFQNSEEQKRKTAARYMEPQDTNYVPGIISNNLKNALGLEDHQLPTHIFNMRKYGYPPGHLESAKVASGLSIMDGRGQEEEVSQGIDRDRLYAFAGYNSPIPPGYVDEHRKHNAPKFSPHQNINLFYEHVQEKHRNEQQQQRRSRKRDNNTDPNNESPNKRHRCDEAHGSSRTSITLMLENQHGNSGGYHESLRIDTGRGPSPAAFVDYSMLFSPGSRDVDMRQRSQESSSAAGSSKDQCIQRYLPNPAFKAQGTSGSSVNICVSRGSPAISSFGTTNETCSTFKSPERPITPRAISPSLIHGYSFRDDSPGTLARAELALRRAQARGLIPDNDKTFGDLLEEEEMRSPFINRRPTPLVVDLEEDDEMCLQGININNASEQSSNETRARANSDVQMVESNAVRTVKAKSTQVKAKSSSQTTDVSSASSDRLYIDENNRNSQKSEVSSSSASSGRLYIDEDAKRSSQGSSKGSLVTEVSSASSEELVVDDDEDVKIVSPDSQPTNVSSGSSGRLVIDHDERKKRLDQRRRDRNSQDTDVSSGSTGRLMIDEDVMGSSQEIKSSQSTEASSQSSGTSDKVCIDGDYGSSQEDLDSQEILDSEDTKPSEIEENDITILFEQRRENVQIEIISEEPEPEDSEKPKNDSQDLESEAIDKLNKSADNSPTKSKPPNFFLSSSPIKSGCNDPGETQDVVEDEDGETCGSDYDDTLDQVMTIETAVPQGKPTVGVYINKFRELPETSKFAEGMMDLLLHEPEKSTGRFDRVLTALKKRKRTDRSQCFTRRVPESPPTPPGSPSKRK